MQRTAGTPAILARYYRRPILPRHRTEDQRSKTPRQKAVTIRLTAASPPFWPRSKSRHLFRKARPIRKPADRARLDRPVRRKAKARLNTRAIHLDQPSALPTTAKGSKRPAARQTRKQRRKGPAAEPLGSLHRVPSESMRTIDS